MRYVNHKVKIISRRKREEMSLQVEKLEGNMAKLTIEASAEEFDRQLRRLIRKKRARSVFLVSVKVRFPAR